MLAGRLAPLKRLGHDSVAPAPIDTSRQRSRSRPDAGAGAPRRGARVAAMRHLFVCTNTVASGKPACGRTAGTALVAAVQRELLVRRGAARVTGCGCLGPCFDGPNAVVYPDGVWYGGLTLADASALVDHLLDGQVLEARRLPAPGEDEDAPGE